MILVDPRAGSKELAVPLRALDIEIELAELEYGDLCWMGSGPDGAVPVGVELKTLPDFLQSMRNGRLAGRQIPGLLAQYSAAYLIIEGAWRCSSDTGLAEVPRRGGWAELRLGSSRFRAADIESYLTSLDTLTQLRVRRSRNRSETLFLVECLYRWWQKRWEDHGSLKVLYSPAPPSPLPVTHSLVRRVAVQLPGVGWERSAAVEAAFPSVLEMATADERRWREVPGIGKVLAKRIVREIRNNKE